jgi:hypothetical protein
MNADDRQHPGTAIDPYAPPAGGTRRFLIAAAITLGVLGAVAGTLLYAIGQTSDPDYVRSATIQPEPTVNIRGQLD